MSLKISNLLPRLADCHVTLLRTWRVGHSGMGYELAFSRPMRRVEVIAQLYGRSSLPTKFETRATTEVVLELGHGEPGTRWRFIAPNEAALTGILMGADDDAEVTWPTLEAFTLA